MWASIPGDAVYSADNHASDDGDGGGEEKEDLKIMTFLCSIVFTVSLLAFAIILCAKKGNVKK